VQKNDAAVPSREAGAESGKAASSSPRLDDQARAWVSADCGVAADQGGEGATA